VLYIISPFTAVKLLVCASLNDANLNDDVVIRTDPPAVKFMLVEDSIVGVPTEVIANADAVTAPVFVSEPLITTGPVIPNEPVIIALPVNGNPDPDDAPPPPANDNTVTAPLPLAFTSKSFENVIVLTFENGTPVPSKTVIAAVAVKDDVGRNVDLLPDPPTKRFPSGIPILDTFAIYKSLAVRVPVDVMEPVTIWFPLNEFAEFFTANVSKLTICCDEETTPLNVTGIPSASTLKNAPPLPLTSKNIEPVKVRAVMEDRVSASFRKVREILVPALPFVPDVPFEPAAPPPPRLPLTPIVTVPPPLLVRLIVDASTLKVDTLDMVVDPLCTLIVEPPPPPPKLVMVAPPLPEEFNESPLNVIFCIPVNLVKSPSNNDNAKLVPEVPLVPAPDVPEVPLVPAPDVPEVPLVPAPDVPEVPLVPAPDVPLLPDEPETPVEPETPDVPDVPDIPDVPALILSSKY
jgi:hypothetical protein